MNLIFNYIINHLIGCNSKTTSGKLKLKLVSIIPLTTFALISIYTVLLASKLGYWDFWLFSQGIFADSKVRFLKYGPFYFENEHIQNSLIFSFWINTLLTGGDNRVLSIITIIFSATQLAIISKHIKLPETTKYWKEFLIAIFLSSLCFPFSACTQYFEGFSGLSWIGSDLCVVLAAHYIHKYSISQNRSDEKLSLIKSTFFALLGGITYSSSFAVYPILVIAIIFCKKTRDRDSFLLPISCVSTLVGFLTFRMIVAPSYDVHPGLSELNIVKALGFNLLFLGGPWFSGLVALYMGIIVAGFTIIAFHKSEGPLVSFWKILIIYGLTCALQAALFRSSMYIDTALSSRYMTIPSLIVVGLTGIYLEKTKIVSLKFLALISTLAVIPLYTYNDIYADYTIHQSEKNLAGLAIYNNIDDNGFIQVLNKSYPKDNPTFPDYARKQHREILKYDDRCLKLGSKLPENHNLEKVSDLKFKVKSKNKNFFLLRIESSVKGKCLLATDSNKIVQGLLIFLPNKDLVPEWVGFGTFALPDEFEGYLVK